MKSVYSFVSLRYVGGANDKMYVALDRDSGGYPYGVFANKAHNFETVEKAQDYAEITKSQGPFHVTYLEIFDLELD